MPQAEEPCSLISFESMETPLQIDIIRQPSPPPVLAEVQDLIPVSTPGSITESEYGMENPLPDGLVSSESLLELHIVSLSLSPSPSSFCCSLLYWKELFFFFPNDTFVL